MNIQELRSFQLSDAVKFHDELNPMLFDGDRLDPEVREQLLAIADDFMEHMGIDDLKVKDIVVTGSNAAYSYTPHSDIDLHIIVDISLLNNDKVYRELFNAKKTLYNTEHNITVRGFDVELYVEDSREPAKSLGEYSVLNDKWNKFPSKRRSNFEERAAKNKFKKLRQLAVLALRSQDADLVQQTIDTVKRYRQAGLNQGGEFGPENLAYKALRSHGIVDKLYKHRDRLHSAELSIDEDYDADNPPGPEFKPTMPAGTVKVDVSDVYDWYKLGQHISNLDGLGKHDFGAGPPSTIMAFGDEDLEHEYIKDLERTGLTTTDIDPVDPNQPRGMRRQKVDPTYNVNEDFNKAMFESYAKYLKEITFDFSNAPSYDEYKSDISVRKKYNQLILKHCWEYRISYPSLHKQLYENVWKLNPTLNETKDNDELKKILNLAFGKSISAKNLKPGMTVDMVEIDQRAESIVGITVEQSIKIKQVQHFPDYTMFMTTDGNFYSTITERDIILKFITKPGIAEKGLAYMMLRSTHDSSGNKKIGKWTIDFPGESFSTRFSRQFKESIKIKESSGYIPSEAEKDDPRFKTALTVDVRPDTMKRQAKAMGLGNITRTGIPPTLRGDGKTNRR
jgi:predicted nucleotidyltransferase